MAYALPDVRTRPGRGAVAGAAQHAAALAAERAGIVLADLHDVDQVTDASELWRGVWGSDDETFVSPDLVRALVHSGNHLSGAFRDGRLVAALLGFFAADEHDRSAPFHLHSHILGVRAGERTRGVGFALKLHQRAWALERNIDRITWTFDPLVRTNAVFNIGQLGASATAYHVSFYGAMSDSINGGDESDRVLVDWRLRSPAALAASVGMSAPAELPDLIARGAEMRLSVGDDGGPTIHRGNGAADVDILCQVPDDIVALRGGNPEAARAWRHQLRETMTEAFDRGLVVTAVARSGWYLLSRPDPERS